MEATGSVSDSWLGGGGGSGTRRSDHANSSASGRLGESESGHRNSGRGAADSHTGTPIISSADDATRYRPAKDRRTAQDGGEMVLHGVSAAMASGALPTTHPKSTPTTTTTTTASRDIGAPRQVSGDSIESLRAQGGGKGSGTQGRVAGGQSGEGSNASVADGSSLALGGNSGDGREQARRQIDQALRDRALRRRTRCSVCGA